MIEGRIDELHPTGPLGLKKELGVSNRNIHGLMNEGGSYMSEAKSWNDTPPRAADGRQDTAAVLAPGHEIAS